MSQAGIVDVIGTHPEIPTLFIANVGEAVPIANTLELLGEVVAAGTNPFRSIGSGNTITYQAQISQAIASTNAANIGLSAFSSSHFAVDANGFVTLNSSALGVLSVSGTANRITSTGGQNPVIDIAATYVGQTSITTLGTIATGVWQGTAVGPTFGGTGQTTYTTGDILYASASNTLSKLAATTNGFVLTLAAGIPSWAAASSGTVTSVSGTANRITSTGGATPVIDIAATYVGQSSITTLGTITTGVWNGTTIAVANGGTSLTTLTPHALYVGNGTSAPNAVAVGATGTVLAGSTGADPSFTATPSVTSITLGGGNAITTYTEGPWTPNLQINGSSTGITYTTQAGYYYRINNNVTIYLYIVLSSKGASAGAVTISNLPVATGTNPLRGSIPAGYFDQVTAVGYTTLGLYFLNNSSTVANFAISGSAVGATNLANTNISNTFAVLISGSYQVN